MSRRDKYPREPLPLEVKLGIIEAVLSLTSAICMTLLLLQMLSSR